jgi:hypothetical protein
VAAALSGGNDCRGTTIAPVARDMPSLGSMPRLLLLLPLLLATLAAPRAARADQLDDQINAILSSDTMAFVAEAARRGLVRFQRSVTIGPTISGAASLTLDDNTSDDTQISGGLALLTYDIPSLPTMEQLRAVLLSGLRSAVEEQIRTAIARGEPLSEEQQRNLVLATWQRLKDELMRELHPSHFEKPRFLLLAEVGHVRSADIWDVRVMAGHGLGPVYLAVGLSLAFAGDDTYLAFPVELSVPILLTDGLRSPVANLFARVDLPLAAADDQPKRGLIGVRLALDVL